MRCSDGKRPPTHFGCETLGTSLVEHNLLLWYGVVDEHGIAADRLSSRRRDALKRSQNCSLPESRDQPACRGLPNWCALTPEQAQTAPATLFGTMPCELLSRCSHLRSQRFFTFPSMAGDACLRQRRIVILGDSILSENAFEWVLLLSRRSPRFMFQFMALGCACADALNAHERM